MITGQLSAMDLVPRSCGHCGYEVSPDFAYDFRWISRAHAEVAPGVCAEMDRWKQNYLLDAWSLQHFDEWFDIAPPGTEPYEQQLARQRESAEHCRRKSVEHFGEKEVVSWTAN